MNISFFHKRRKTYHCSLQRSKEIHFLLFFYITTTDNDMLDIIFYLILLYEYFSIGTFSLFSHSASEIGDRVGRNLGE